MKLPPKSMPIRRHLLLFAVLILIPQLLVGVALGTWYAASERDRVEDSAVAAAAAVRSQLDRELDAMKAALEALATSPNAALGDFKSLREQALALLKFRGTAISVRERDHQQVMNTLVEYGEPLPISRDPALVAADDRVFASGQATVSDLYVGALSKRQFVLVNVPLIRDGEVRYAMNMAVAPGVIQDLISGAGVPPGWIVTVLDGTSRVIARSRDGGAFLGRPAPPSFSEMVSGRTGTVQDVRALDGTPVFTAYDTLETSGWRVIVAVPHAILSAPTRALGFTLAAVVFLALATSAALARLYSLRLEREVGTLQTMAQSAGRDAPVGRKEWIVSELENIANALRGADISLKARDRHKDLLLAELNHRVRNTLSVLLSVVNRTIRGDGQQEALAKKTAGRIMALSRAHDLLSSAEWAPIALSGLVARTAEQERLVIGYEGPEIMLKPEAVAPLAQALHELAVNQRSHAPATQNAATVRTIVSNDNLRLEWVSPGEQNVVPWKCGFGLLLVRLCLERQLFGTISSLDANGLRADLPLDFVTGSGNLAEPFAARWGKNEKHAPSDGSAAW